jgi:isoleucyl-tRNA synthetase
MTSCLYSKLNFPHVNEIYIDENLEKQMEIVKGIVSTIHSIRKKNKIRLRQPLNKIMIYSNNDINFVLDYKDIILNETNTKNIEIIKDTSLIMNFVPKPNLKALGQKYKNKIKDITKEITTLSKESINKLINNEYISLKCGINISKEDCLFDSIPLENTCIDKYENFIIALDINITDNLEKEGISNDFINFVQNYRKKNFYDINDEIIIYIHCTTNKIIDSLKTFNKEISKHLLCNKMIFNEHKDDDYEYFSISNENIYIKIFKK